MPRVLLVCTGYTSNLFSSIACATDLRARGFDVVFAAPQDSTPWIKAQTFEHVVIPHAVCNAFSGYARKFDYGFPTAEKSQARSDQAALSILAEGFADVLAQIEPDVVLSDCEHHSAVLQTIAAGIPIVLLAFMYFSPPGPMSPPLTSNSVPGRSFRGSPFSIGFDWRAFHLKWNTKLSINHLKYWGADFGSAYRALAKTLQVPLDQISTTGSFQAPWSYKLPTFYLLPEALQFPVTMPEGHIFIGAQTLMDRPDMSHVPEFQRFVEEPEKTKIYVSFGTVRRAPRRIFDKLIQLAQQNPKWLFLVATPQANQLKTQNPPDNFLAASWVPQIDALRAADCAIFHGGAGTLLECVHTNTPMLVVPNGLDGCGNGARVAFHNVGLSTKPNTSAKSMERQIKTLLSDPVYKMSLEEKRAEIAGASAKAADVLYNYLSETKNAPRCT